MGIRHGDSLSPLLFVIFMDLINALCKNEIRNMGLEYRYLNPVLTQDLLHADNLLLIATSERQLKKKIPV